MKTDKKIAGQPVYLTEEGHFFVTLKSGEHLKAPTLEVLQAKVKKVSEAHRPKIPVAIIHFDEWSEEPPEISEGLFRGISGSTGRARIQSKNGRISDARGSSHMVPAGNTAEIAEIKEAAEEVTKLHVALEAAKTRLHTAIERDALHAGSRGQIGAVRALERSEEMVAELQELEKGATS